MDNELISKNGNITTGVMCAECKNTIGVNVELLRMPPHDGKKKMKCNRCGVIYMEETTIEQSDTANPK